MSDKRTSKPVLVDDMSRFIIVELSAPATHEQRQKIAQRIGAAIEEEFSNCDICDKRPGTHGIAWGSVRCDECRAKAEGAAQGSKELADELSDFRDELFADMRPGVELLDRAVAALRAAEPPDDAKALRYCYSMSEPHLSGYRLILGFETLEQVQAAQIAVARIAKASETKEENSGSVLSVGTSETPRGAGGNRGTTVETDDRQWLIRKRGYYYRPDRAGYTSNVADAGRYTEAEAKAEAAIEPSIMQAIHISQAVSEPEG